MEVGTNIKRSKQKLDVWRFTTPLKNNRAFLEILKNRIFEST